MNQRLARTSVILALLPVLRLSPIYPQEPVPASFTEFKHSKHVPNEWTDNPSKGDGNENKPISEYWRDCQGCHDYSKPAAERTPLKDLCVRCHIHGTKHREVVREQLSSSPVRGGDYLFDHRDHLRTLKCGDCHPPKADKSVPDHFDVPGVGIGYCFKCHEKGKSQPAEHARFIKELNRKLQARQERGATLRPFSHWDHLSAEDLGKNHEKCVECHVEISSADAKNLKELQFSTKPCDKCHTSGFETEVYQKDSLTAATFVHRHHLRPKALEADRTIQEERCFRCHEYEFPGDRTTTSEGDRFLVRDFFHQRSAGGPGPKSCMTCHNPSEWEVKNHGKIEKCRDCHEIADEFIQVASLAKNRPTVEVKRPKVAGFVASGHKHPFITDGEQDQDTGKDCAPCHVARLAELPSRVNSLEFNHRAHLVDKYQPEDCEVCHSAVKVTSSPADIKAHLGPKGVAFHYGPDKCVACHKGRELTPTFEETGVTRRVLAFSHLDHLRRKPPGMDHVANCKDCHVLEEKADVISNNLPPRIAACTQCHGHKDKEHWDITGDVEKEELDRCNLCHVIGVPGNGSKVPMGRLRLKAVNGAQVHKPEDVCDRCHQVRPPPEQQRYASPTLRGWTEKIVPHKLMSKAEIAAAGGSWTACTECQPGQSPHADWHFRDAAYCIDCHWFRLKPSYPLKGLPYENSLPNERRIRYGDQKQGRKHPFPGIPPAK